MKRKENEFQRMTEHSVKAQVLRLAVPSAIGLLAVSAYSLADSAFLSGLGADAGAAVSVLFPVHVLMQAVGYTLGMGGGSLFSRALGRQEETLAGSCLSLSFFLSLLIGGGILAAGLFATVPIVRFLGATDTVVPYAVAYARPLFCAAPVMCGSFVLSQFLRAGGHAVSSMAGLCVGSFLNILLDPILIHRFGYGVAGASVSTLLSQSCGFLVLLFLCIRSGDGIRLFPLPKHGAFPLAGKILVSGLPSLLRQGLSGTATVLLTHAAKDLGSSAVTAMSVTARIFLLVFSFCLGIGQGMMPVVGFNHGAALPERAGQAYRFALRFSTLLMFGLSLPLLFLTPQILSLFQSDDELLRIGIPALRAQSAVLFTHGIVTCTILYDQAAGKAVRAAVLAAARQGFFFLPLIFWMPRAFGIPGLQLTQPLADFLTFLFAVPFLIQAWKSDLPPKSTL